MRPSLCFVLMLLAACGGPDTSVDDTSSGDDTDTSSGTDVAAIYGGCTAEMTIEDGGGVFQGKSLFTYDDRGFLVGWENHDQDDQTTSTFVQTFRDDGAILTQDRDDVPLGSVDSHMTWTWDGDCNTQATMGDATTVSMTSTNTCDDQDHVVERDNRNQSGQIAWIQYSDWNAAGDDVEERYDYTGDGTIEVAYAATYDDDHHRLTFGGDADVDGVAENPDTFTWDGDQLVRWDIAGGGYQNYEYDDAGRLTTQTGHDADGTVSNTLTTVWTCP